MPKHNSEDSGLYEPESRATPRVAELLCSRDTFDSLQTGYKESLIKFRPLAPVKFICVTRSRCMKMLFQ